MTEPLKTLILRLEAPLQSWGLSSQLFKRRTYRYPTKSAIAGLLCSALGETPPSRKRVSQLAGLRMTAYRVKSGTLLRDYQTVGGGYSVETDRGMILHSAEGKPRATSGVGEAALVSKYYLQDAAFIVTLTGSSELINICADAVKKPKHALYLGRKCCLPSSKIYVGTYYEDEVHSELMRHGVTKGCSYLSDADTFESGTDTIPDLPIDFSERSFALRRVCESEFS